MFLFDLDGTLVDTLADIAGAMNHALVTHGHRAHGLDVYRRVVGEGVLRLAERVLEEQGAPIGDAPQLVETYRPYYRAHILDASRPYPGIPELLDLLVGRGTPVAVLSNKPDEPTRQIVGALFPNVPWVVVHGERAGFPRKPDPTVALAIAGSRAPASCSFVGDTPIDVATARAAGMRAVGVAWGFRPVSELAGADVIVHDPLELGR
jgi:phosphoglycolate phosphatase